MVKRESSSCSKFGEEIYRVIVACQRRSMAFEKFKELCIDIGFSIFVAFSSRTRSVIVNRISVSSQCRAISPVDGRGGGKKYPGVSIS